MDYRNRGLECLYSPLTRSSGQCIFVAIHGINGDRIKSWTTPYRKPDQSKTSATRAGSNFCWLKDLLPAKFPDAHVLTFGYNNTIEAAADALLGDLVDYVLNVNFIYPYHIIFIGHCPGGNLAKQLFLVSSPTRTSRREVQSIHAAVKGFIFFGTRHRGFFDVKMKIPKISRAFISLDPRGSAKQSLRVVDSFMDQYRRINLDFQQDGGEDLPTACFYETIPMPYFGIVVSSEDASLNLPWAENKPGEAMYTELSRISTSNPVQTDSVTSAVQKIWMQARGLVDTAAPGLQKQSTPELTHDDIYADDSNVRPGLKVLALDGGGIRGLFAIIILQQVMEEVRKLDCPNNPESLRPCDYFDIIGGTSTGGLLGIMLGRLQMDLVSCKLAYKSLSSTIFRSPSWPIPGKRWIDAVRGAPWYSGDALELATRDLVSERITLKERDQIIMARNVPSEAKLKSSGLGKTKTFVCAIVDQSEACERLRTYQSSAAGPGASCTIWEACRATSAASLYFPSITINGRTYWDGGMNSNNPILQVIEEAKSEFGDGRAFQAIVSIGTGKGPIADPSSHVLGVVNYAIKRMADTQQKHTEFVSRYPDLQEQYFRFNEENELYKIDLADWKKLGEVERLANEYIASVAGRKLINSCARKLARGASNT